ncbi:MAG: NUDIX domain-containing protein [Actinomycetales bacterium]
MNSDSSRPSWIEVQDGLDGESASLRLGEPADAQVPTAGVDLSLVVHDLLRQVVRVQAVLTPSPVLTAACLAAGLRQEGRIRRPGGAHDLLVARLREDVDPRQDPLPTLAAGFATVLRAAGWYISDPDGRVLMVDPVYKDGLDIPGGVCDPAEDLATTACRELAEELGLRWPVADLLALDFVLDNGRRGDLELGVFDGGVHPPEFVDTLTLPDGELSGARWMHPDDLDGHGPPAFVRRLRSVHLARRQARLPGPTLILRDGVAIEPGAATR